MEIDVNRCRAVACRKDEAGNHFFEESPSLATYIVPGLIEHAIVWESPSDASIPGNIGGPPKDMQFPPPGATRFGIARIMPRSAGKVDIRNTSAQWRDNIDIGDQDPSMHRTNSIDYEFIISGKIDLELEGGVRRTFGAGDCIVMGGVMHSWQNRYDEPCVFAVFIVGTGEPVG